MMCNILSSRVNEILWKSSKTKLIRIKTDGVNSWFTLFEVIKGIEKGSAETTEMDPSILDAYAHLNDGILDIIREQVDIKEVVNNLCMRVSLMHIF